METDPRDFSDNVETRFQKDLVVWKHYDGRLYPCYHVSFQKDLVVWKPGNSSQSKNSFLPVSEGLSSVETSNNIGFESGVENEFQKDLVVWKLCGLLIK